MSPMSRTWADVGRTRPSRGRRKKTERKGIHRRVCLIVILIIMTAFCGMSACTNQVSFVSGNAFLLDTIINIKIYYDQRDPADAEIIDEAFAVIESCEDLLSVHIEGSDLDRLKNLGLGD